MPVGPSSSGGCACPGSPLHLSMRPPPLRLKPSCSNQLLVLAPAIPGANPFSDVLPPALRFQERLVQKNETHPTLAQGFSKIVLLSLICSAKRCKLDSAKRFLKSLGAELVNI